MSKKALFTIEIRTVYSSLDIRTLTDYFENTFKGKNNPIKVDALMKNGYVKFEDAQPNGRGHAVTEYFLKEEK